MPLFSVKIRYPFKDILLAWGLIWICLSAHGQCIDRSKIKYGGSYDFISYTWGCPTYMFEYGGYSSTHWDLLNPIDINKIGTDIFPLKVKVERRIREYAGEEFFKRVKFSSVEVVFKDSLQKMLDSGRSGVVNNNCSAKYYFYYNFLADTLAVWRFGVAVNDAGTIISQFTFPSKKNYKPINAKITYCELLSRAKKIQPDILPVEGISLEYDPKEKSFYWLISQEIKGVKAGKNDFNEVAIDAADTTKATTFKGYAFVDF